MMLMMIIFIAAGRPGGRSPAITITMITFDNTNNNSNTISIVITPGLR